MTQAYLNRIATAVPPHDVHQSFLDFAATLLPDARTRTVFARMAERSGIAHRYSPFRPGRLDAGEVDADGFFRRGAFPDTAIRMRAYEPLALELALRAVAGLGDLGDVTHIIVASCTGFSAPGLDLQLAHALGLRADVERTMIGFMGCAAAVPALRAAAAAVHAQPGARVLVVNCELCTLHMQESAELAKILSFMLFADGSSAALVSADPHGIALGDFRAAILPDSADLITWHIGAQGFDMHLSGKVPGRIAAALRAEAAGSDAAGLLRGEAAQAIDLWAVHAGGSTVLDAVEIGLALPPGALAVSRGVLHDFGNMSSATVMFVLSRLLAAGTAGARGMALAFGPGMVAESFRFRMVG